MTLLVLDCNDHSGGTPNLRKSPRRPPPTPLPVNNLVLPSPLPSATLPQETPVPPTPTHGLRAQLNHLLPRHTLFHVRLQIHEIASVPLINGEFGVRWRFKNVQAVPGSKQGFLGMVKRRNRSRPRTPSGKESEGQAKPFGTGSEDSGGSENTSPELGSPEDKPSIPSVVVSKHHSGSPSQSNTPHSNSSPERHAHASVLSPSTSSSRIPTLSELSSHLYRQPEEQSTPSLSATTPVDGYSSSRGMTPFGQLKDHKVRWEQTVDVVVKMDVERDTLELLPNELKLEVMQRVIPNDPSAPQNPRLGVLYLNLAQYASPSTPSVTRRYLLQKSKTNATLKLTVQLECIGGEKNYVAPPLPKGEILGGVKGVLDSDVLKIRPRIAGLERGMASAMGGSLGLFGDLPVGYGPGVADPSGKGKGKATGESQYSMDMLGLAYGPKMTENIIDAIFNPVPTTDKTKEGPFTYYIDPNEVYKPPAQPQSQDDTHREQESSGPSSPSSGTESMSSPNHRHRHVRGAGATGSVGSAGAHGHRHAHGQVDGASVYSTESSSTSESVSVHSHHSHRSAVSNTHSNSTHSTHSSLGIGLGVGLGAIGITDARISGEVGEPNGRMKSWWKRIGHAPGSSGGSGSSSPGTRHATIMPAGSSPAMPSIQVTT